MKLDTQKKHYRAYDFSVSECKQVENNQGVEVGVIKGYASTFGNVDRYDDVILAGAFIKTLENYKKKGRMIRMLWTHKCDELIGGYPASLAREDNKGLYVEGQINLETQRGREAYSLAKQGVLEDFSIGFTINEASTENIDGVAVRVISEVNLFEVSLVGEPMNPEAQITQVKSFGSLKDLTVASRDTVWEPEKARERCVKYLGGEIDDSTANLIDVKDGKLALIPNAVFNAAAQVYIQTDEELSENNRVSLEEEVEAYYEKMNMDSPFISQTSFRLDQLDSITERTLEKVLKKGIQLRSTNAKTVIAALKSLKREAEEIKDLKLDAEQSFAINEIHKLFLRKL
jgi:HK97 family phage prohead protease